MAKQRKIENLVYLVIWLVIFLFPAVSLLYDVVTDQDANTRFTFEPIWDTWKEIFPFLILFLVHNFFIAPYIFKNGKKTVYATLTIFALAVFIGFEYGKDRYDFNKYIKPAMEKMNEEREKISQDRQKFFEQLQQSMQIDSTNPMFFPPMEKPDSAQAGPVVREGDPDGRRGLEGPRGPEGPRRDRGGFMGWGRYFGVMFKFILALMVVFANLGVALSFQAQANEKKMKELEHENMLQQLQYLRYQINPHFFMNTLNNIHALVDIDPDQAKKCILELSKLMRYVLYEGGKPTIPLEKEIDFLTQYISLMRIRYTDSVKIDVSFPENTKGTEIPPLLYVSFVENAFKHGISYKAESFINVSMSIVGDRLLFCCENSLNETNDDPHSGIGLENVKARMGLLYGDDYNLKIERLEDRFKVTSDVPLSSNLSDKLYQTT